MKITSDLAILDVKAGRQKLYDKLPANPLSGQAGRGIPVTITGYIVGSWGRDDGTSREFQVDVTGVELGKETPLPERQS